MRNISLLNQDQCPKIQDTFNKYWYSKIFSVLLWKTLKIVKIDLVIEKFFEQWN